MAGEPDAAGPHLPRIAAMGFDWLLVGPFAGPANAEAIVPWREAANASALKLMVRLRPGELERLDQYHAKGASGFLLTPQGTAAPAWLDRVAGLQKAMPDALILADMLGQPAEALAAISKTGIGWMLNSFAWWDVRASWFLDQQHRFAPGKRTIATVEPWPKPRLMQHYAHLAPDDLARTYAARYLLAACVSSGLLCPMGFEIGASSPLDDEAYPPGAWDTAQSHARFDLTDEIARINRVKAETPALQGETHLRRASSPDSPVLALAKQAAGAPPRATALILVNSSPAEASLPASADLIAASGANARFRQILPAPSDEAAGNPPWPKTLAPYGSLLLLSEPEPPPERLPSPAASERRLRTLAANRIVIEAVSPEVDGGDFPVKRVLGQCLTVEADIFIDGHDSIGACLHYRHASDAAWQEVRLEPLGNDRWRGVIPLRRIGCVFYFVEAWRDAYATWCAGLTKKLAAGRPLASDLAIGLKLIARYIAAAPPETKAALQHFLTEIATLTDEQDLSQRLVAEPTLHLMRQAGYRENLSRSSVDFQVRVDRPLAANAAWYRLHAQSTEPGGRTAFADIATALPHIRALGFDVVSLPPVHPASSAGADAVGSAEGGHDALRAEFGSFEDFTALIRAARRFDLELALDFAVQCSADHPWIKEHPEWFARRPDGALHYDGTEPDNTGQQTVSPRFYGEALPALWLRLRDVVLFWIEKGVRIFRVKDPHTKPLPFWEWLIGDVQESHPDVIFLAETVTGPKMMKRLAKIGFTQSCSYFTWRNTKQELTDYLTEITGKDCRNYMRPNLLIGRKTPAPSSLQENGRTDSQIRLVLAATLSPLYGIPAGYEHGKAAGSAGRPNSSETEMGGTGAFDRDMPGGIKQDIRLINRIRRDNPALWQFTNLTFLNAWNDQILCYYKINETKDNLVIVAVNLDAKRAQGAPFEIPLWEFGLPDDAAVEALDLVRGERLTWTGKVQQLWLDPKTAPYALWRLIPPASLQS